MFYVKLGQDWKVVSNTKFDERGNFFIGPFDTQELAQAYLDAHSHRHACKKIDTATATTRSSDFRVRNIEH